MANFEHTDLSVFLFYIVCYTYKPYSSITLSLKKNDSKASRLTIKKLISFRNPRMLLVSLDDVVHHYHHKTHLHFTHLLLSSL